MNKLKIELDKLKTTIDEQNTKSSEVTQLKLVMSTKIQSIVEELNIECDTKEKLETQMIYFEALEK